MRTETPAAGAFPGPPLPAVTPMSSWVTYKTQIEFGFAILAYLMVLVGSVTVVQANPDARWKYDVAVLPVIPAQDRPRPLLGLYLILICRFRLPTLW